RHHSKRASPQTLTITKRGSSLPPPGWPQATAIERPTSSSKSSAVIASGMTARRDSASSSSSKPKAWKIPGRALSAAVFRPSSSREQNPASPDFPACRGHPVPPLAAACPHLRASLSPDGARRDRRRRADRDDPAAPARRRQPSPALY